MSSSLFHPSEEKLPFANFRSTNSLRCPVSGISTMGRATQGVRIMRLKPGEKLVSMARLAESDVGDSDNSGGGDPSESTRDVGKSDNGGGADPSESTRAGESDTNGE